MARHFVWRYDRDVSWDSASNTSLQCSKACCSLAHSSTNTYSVCVCVCVCVYVCVCVRVCAACDHLMGTLLCFYKHTLCITFSSSLCSLFPSCSLLFASLSASTSPLTTSASRLAFANCSPSDTTKYITSIISTINGVFCSN